MHSQHLRTNLNVWMHTAILYNMCAGSGVACKLHMPIFIGGFLYYSEMTWANFDIDSVDMQTHNLAQSIILSSWNYGNAAICHFVTVMT